MSAREECQCEPIRDAALNEEIPRVILDDLLFGTEAISNLLILVRPGDEADYLQLPSSEPIANANTNQVGFNRSSV